MGQLSLDRMVTRIVRPVKRWCLWLDGPYLKAVLGKENAVLLVAVGVKPHGHQVVRAVSSGYRELTASWSGLLRELKARDMS